MSKPTINAENFNQMAEALKPKESYLTRVVERDEENEGIKITASIYDLTTGTEIIENRRRSNRVEVEAYLKALESVTTLEVTTNCFKGEHLKSDLEKIKEILPNLKQLNLLGNKHGLLAERFYLDAIEEVFGEESQVVINLPKEMVETFDLAVYQQAKGAIKNFHNSFGFEAPVIQIEYNDEAQRDHVIAELTDADLDKIIESKAALTLQQRSLMAMVTKINFHSEFQDKAQFEEKIRTISGLFPAAEDLKIDRVFNGPANELNLNLDFSALGKLSKVTSLDIPVTVIDDFKFLNQMQVKNLTLNRTFGEYYSPRVNDKLEKVAQDIETNVAKKVDNLTISPFIEVGGEVLDNLSEKFGAINFKASSRDKPSNVVGKATAVRMAENTRENLR